MQFGEPERVEVRQEEDGTKAFYVSTREGWERIGPEISMVAENYEAGTALDLREPMPAESR